MASRGEPADGTVGRTADRVPTGRADLKIPAEIEPARRAAIDEICRIHLESLPDGFLAEIGARALGELYREIVASSLGLGLVQPEGLHVAAFVIATEDTGKLFRRVMRRRWPVLFWSLLGLVVRRPSTVVRAVELALYPLRAARTVERAELLAIAVDRPFRRRGYATRLIHALDATFAGRGVGSYRVTVERDNAAANALYQALGFVLTRPFTMFGREWNLYSRRVSVQPKR